MLWEMTSNGTEAASSETQAGGCRWVRAKPSAPDWSPTWTLSWLPHPTALQATHLPLLFLPGFSPLVPVSLLLFSTVLLFTFSAQLCLGTMLVLYKLGLLGLLGVPGCDEMWLPSLTWGESCLMSGQTPCRMSSCFQAAAPLWLLK